jgi:hypothetical protein
MAEESHPEPFIVRDCSLIAKATGRRAQNLRELRDGLLAIEATSIHHHFWGRMLRPRFDDPEFHNDFASWARHSLHDYILAERLAVVDPAEHETLEELRRDLVDICEDRLDEREIVPWASHDHQFQFLTAQIVVFETGRVLKNPEEFADLIPRLSRGSIFYHFIDARNRNELGMDDFRVWLRDCGPAWTELEVELATIDPFAGSLADLRDAVSLVCDRFAAGGRRP